MECNKQENNKCPVCEGKGIVPGGFYNSLPGCTGTTASVTEYCRSCNGQGVLPTVKVCMNGVTYQNGFPLEKIILKPQTPESILTKQLLQVKAEFAAARDELAAEKAKLEIANTRLKMYKDGLYLSQCELSLREISEFLHTFPLGSIWYFIASKWDAVTARYNTLRQIHEDAAGMGLDDSFFVMNGINPNEICDEKTEKLRQRAEQAEAQCQKLNREISELRRGEGLKC